MGHAARLGPVDVRVVTTVFGALILLGIVEMLRRRRLREKYAVLWLATCIPIIPLAVFPSALDHLSSAVGVKSGVSLVLFLAIVFLLALSMHLSWEVSTLEEETRTLAEEIALLRLELRGDAPHETVEGGP